MTPNFDLQGHRGARGLKPENTLPAFEAALDLLVSSLETDLHLTRDGVPVLFHDDALNDRLVRLEKPGGAPDPSTHPLLSTLTLQQVRCYVADLNPDQKRFPKQDSKPTPVAEAFTKQRGTSPYLIPALDDLFAFVAAYAGDLGKRAGKTDLQRNRAGKVRFALEVKRVPFRPEFMGDSFDVERGGELERQFVDLVRRHGVAERAIVQSFDHRVIRAVRKMEPKIIGSALTANTAPALIPDLLTAANAQVYSPDFLFLDAAQIQQAHEGKVRVVPYTVNDVKDMNRLLDWGVDGIITDYPDRLAPLLQTRHLNF